MALIATAGAVGLGTILYTGRSKTDASVRSFVRLSTRVRPTRALMCVLCFVFFSFLQGSDSSMYPTIVRDRMFATYGYFASGIAITAASAVACAQSPRLVGFAAQRPIAFVIGGAVVTIGSMLGMYMTKNKTVKQGLWLTFVTAQGATMLPVVFMGGAVVAQAAAATGIMVGSLSAVAAVAPSDSFLWMRGGLTIGMGLLVAASFGSMFFPGSSLLQNATLYGGLGLFGAMQLYDTQKIAHRARTETTREFEPITESVGIYLNTVNIFLRFVQIFSNSNNNRRK